MRRELLTCPHCGAKMAFDRPECLRCGQRIVRQPPPDTSAADRATRRKRVQLGLVAAVVMVMAAFVIGLIGRARAVEAVPSTVLLAARTAALTVQDADTDLVSVSTHQPEAVAAPARNAAASAGYAAFKAGDYGTALARFKEALVRDPNDGEVLNNTGQVLVELNRPQEAVSYLERAVVATPKETSYRFNLAVALSRAGNFQRAASTYRELVEATPGDARAHHNLGLALRQAGRDEEAISAFQQATTLAPQEAPPWLGLALSLDRTGKGEDAAGAYERYLSLEPDNADAARIRERIAQLRHADQPASSSSGGRL